MTRYVVKVRRFYGDQEATNVLYGPCEKLLAEDIRDGYVLLYQEPDAYYIEEFDEEKWGRGFDLH